MVSLTSFLDHNELFFSANTWDGRRLILTVLSEVVYICFAPHDTSLCERFYIHSGSCV